MHLVDNDNDNDNDTLREVPHQSNEGLALQARVSGPWPHEKESVVRRCISLRATNAHTRCCAAKSFLATDKNYSATLDGQGLSLEIFSTASFGLSQCRRMSLSTRILPIVVSRCPVAGRSLIALLEILLQLLGMELEVDKNKTGLDTPSPTSIYDQKCPPKSNNTSDHS